MVVLGLGSNLGNRLYQLRAALKHLQALPRLTVFQVSPVYQSNALLPANAPADWDIPHLNAAIRCETTYTPEKLLEEIKKIEFTLGRKVHPHWGPREIDIDILIWQGLQYQSPSLTIPHQGLYERPFALLPLTDVAPDWYDKKAIQVLAHWGSRLSGSAPFNTKQIAQRIDTPQLVGILNLTENSFSDGGQYVTPEQAEKKIIALVTEGADVIDIGAESTAPMNSPISAEKEWARLEPVLSNLKTLDLPLRPTISIDTRHIATAKKCLAIGVDWINDVTGFEQPGMRELMAKHKSMCLAMHHLSIPPTRENILPREKPVIEQVAKWASTKINQLEKIGIDRERIIIDPGIGFGKSAEQSLMLIKKINLLKSLNVKILVGHSRKSFLNLFINNAFHERDLETIVINLLLANQCVDYLRVHNVAMAARAFKVWGALR